MGRVRRCVTGLAAGAAVLLAACSANHSSTSAPTRPAVRSPVAAAPATRAPGTAGALLSATAERAELLPGIGFGGRAWLLSYRTTGGRGEPLTASGTLLVPARPAAGRPLVAVAPATRGLADRCAPSRTLRSGHDLEAYAYAQLLSRGWAVAVADTPGLGSAGEHPFAANRALGPSVLDVVRAARAVPGAGVPAAGPIGLEGYSEGGGAVGEAAQLQPSYAPDVVLAGVAVGGVDADPLAAARALDGTGYSWVVGYALAGLAAAYPALDVRAALTPLGASTLDRLRDSCSGDAPSAEPGGTRLTSLVTGDLLARPDVAAALTAGTLGSVAPSAPVLLQHAVHDDLLPFTQATGLRDRWCTAGARVRLEPIPTGGHVAGAVAATPGAVSWLADRFAGRPADGC